MPMVLTYRGDNMLVLGLVEVPWWVLLILLLVAWYQYETRNFNFFKKQGVPFRKPIPLLGTLHLGKRDMKVGTMEMMTMFRDKGLVGGFMRSMPVLTVWDEKFLADVLVKEANNFMDRFALKDPGGLSAKMLFNMEGERWKTTRNEISPTFSTGKLKGMNSEIDRCAKALGEFLLEKAETGEPFEVKEYVGAYTMDIIASTGFGIQLNTLRDRDNPFVINAKNLLEANLASPKILFAMFFPSATSFLRKLGFYFDPMSKECMDFFVNVIKQAIEIRKADDDQSRVDFLQIMLNAQKGEGVEGQDDDIKLKGLTADEILANAITFFQAGYDTTAGTLSFLMYSLATNPDIQTRLIEEIDSVVKDKESVPYSVLQELPYLEKCLNETLRLYPIALITNRVANKDITIQGVFIKKDMPINVPIYAMHHDPEWWPEPEKFDPERFSAENKGKRNLYHYLPFGAGPRNCIGQRLAMQEMKMAIVHILKRVTVETCEKTEIPIRFEPVMLLKPAGLWLKTVRR